jgi:hypothetical protein
LKMTIKVPLSNVVNPQSLAVRVGLAPMSTTPAALQIYTGTVAFEFPRGDSLGHTQVESFVPLDASFNVQSYPVPPTAITVVGSLTSLDVQDTTYIGAIDTVTVDLEPRSFPGIGGSPQVLILKGTAAVRNGGVARIAYQVTVLTDLSTLGNGLAPSVINLPRTSAP